MANTLSPKHMATIWVGLIIGLLTSLLVGCTSPTAPDGLPDVRKMQAWAAAHAFESCVLHNGRGLLVPIGQEGTDEVMAISFCNPSE